MGKKKQQIEKKKRIKLEQNQRREQNKLQRIQPISNDLEMGKGELSILFDEANDRISKIKSQGFTSYALDRVESYNSKDFFDIDDIQNKDDLLKELYRVRVFLNDKGSTVEGAILDTALINAEIYKGKFGNEYYTKEHHYAKYDTTVIDKDLASRAFESYRNLESTKAGKIALEGGYGSENLINILYDAEVRGYDSLSYGTDILETFMKQDEDVWDGVKKQSDKIARISGIIDNIAGKMRF